MYRFEKLEVWKLSVQYGLKVYRKADTLPKNETLGLISQLKRAALSISSNIAEGSGSSTQKDFAHFLDIAIKSTIETVSQLLFASDLGFLPRDQVQELYDESEVLIKMIQGLKHYLKKPRATSYMPHAKKEVLHDSV